MTITRDQLAAALIDVRKAYRLIHAYQRRVWDLMLTIDHTLASANLEFRRWAPMNVLPPPKSKTRFFVDRWAWDFLPAYELGCEWQGNSGANAVRRVFVIAAADTGYNNRGKGEPDPITFEPVEKSLTQIRVGLWTAATTSPNWDDAWQQVENDARPNETYTLAGKSATYTYRYFCVDIADLVDDTATKARLLQPIEEWLGSKLS